MMEVIFLDQEFSYLLMGLSDIGINYGGWTVDDVYDLWETYFYLDSAEDVRDVYDAWQSQVRFLAIQSAIIRYVIWKKR